MAKRPEGLSPCYSSLASPDISASMYFKWSYSGQTSATIKIYDSSGDTLLKTYNVSGSSKRISFADIDYNFQLGRAYYWTVQTQNSQVSVKARFRYYPCEQKDTIAWTHIPDDGDVVINETYFQEIKRNLAIILDDYDNVPENIMDAVDGLFSTEVVPSRTDFLAIEKVMDYLAITLETIKAVDIDEPVEDSLGVSDLEVIRKQIDKLLNTAPKPIVKASFTVDTPTMYRMNKLTAESDGRLDATIDTEWTSTAIPSYNGYFKIDTDSPSRDIRYYKVDFSYGPSDNMYTSELFYHDSFITNGTQNSFDTDWDGLYSSSTIGKAKHSLEVTVVDHRGNESSTYTVNKTYGSNFKAPLGVKEYQLEYQKLKTTATSYSTSGKWTDAYSGKGLSKTVKMSGTEGKIFFRVKAVDLSGLETDWRYSSGVTFDPLTVPDAVKDFKVTSTTTSRINLSWDSAPRATEYQIRRGSKTGTITYSGNGLSDADTGLNSATSYTYYIRAGNRIGWGPWTSTSGKTKSARKTSKAGSTNSESWGNKYGWKTGTKKVYQGEWCNQWSSDHHIEGIGNVCWGKHKGLWFFDHAWWRGELAGRKIISVTLEIERQEEHNGAWSAQKPTFWLHNYGSKPSGQPTLSSKYQSPVSFEMGEKKSVSLPVSYGEALRDGDARGIGIYRDSWGQLPYIIFESKATLTIVHDSQ